ncbi:MAG: phage integrase family protein [Lautropia sp.]
MSAIRPPRRISPTQFAFVRAVLQGLSLREAADRYLDAGADLRLVQRQLREIRTELQAAARRAGAFGDARALLLDMGQIPTGKDVGPATPAPSLEDFRDGVDPDGFYGEAELLNLYQDRYPVEQPNRRAAQLRRLRDRQLRALAVLEQVVVAPPALADPVSSWLEPKDAARLEAVGLATLEQLVNWIRQKGFGWWRPIPRLGEVAGARIVGWLRANGDALGRELPAGVDMAPDRQRKVWQRLAQTPALAVAPLERLAMPADLDGSQGTNRVPGVHRIDARNDYEALAAWLAARAGENPHTQRTYRREAERLLLWSIFERQKPMSSLSVDDAIAFRAFLPDPQPAARWIGGKAAPRLSPGWRPFTGPLSARSVQYAITVVRSMFDWLVRQHYLAHNSFDALPKQDTRSAAAEHSPDVLPLDRGRYLSTGQWAVVREVLATLGTDERAQRVRFAISLAYGTGLRISELVDARVGRLSATLDDEGERILMLRVLGKGGRVREVPFVPQLEDQLNDYLVKRNLPTWIECQAQGLDGIRLLGHLGTRHPPEKPIAPNTLYREIKAVFEQVASLVARRGMAADAEHFRRASTHWLRHTFGRHVMQSPEASINIVQSVLGHASVATTTIYTSEGGTEAYHAVRKATKKRL